MAAPTNAALVKKTLANSEPSTNGPSRHFAATQQFGRFWRVKRTFSEPRLQNRIYEYAPLRGGGGVAHGNSQFDNDRHLKHPWNSGSLQQMGASPRERSFSTNPCSLANPSPIEVGRPRYLVPLICRRLGSGRLLRHESAFVPQIALLIAAATADRDGRSGGWCYEHATLLA